MASAPFTLSSGEARLTAAHFQRWSDLYGVNHRQLRRWIARGQVKNDACPLDAPREMPAWIERNIDKIRAELRSAVNAAAERAIEAAAPVEAPSIVSPATTPSAEKPSERPAAKNTVAPLDLASLGGVEGEAVETFQRIFSAVKKQLEEAYSVGNDDRIRTLHTRLEKAGEAVRKHRAAAEVQAQRRGDLLDKASVLNEFAEALRIIKRMGEFMEERVISDLPDLSPEMLPRVRDAIAREWRKIARVLQNIPSLRTDDDVLQLLAA